MSDTDLPARLAAVLTERFTALGNPFSGMRRNYQGPDGWPASDPVSPNEVAEVLGELIAEREAEIAAVMAVRDQEMEQLRAGIRELASALAAETHNNSPADLITKGHAANRVLELIGERP